MSTSQQLQFIGLTFDQERHSHQAFEKPHIEKQRWHCASAVGARRKNAETVQIYLLAGRKPERMGSESMHPKPNSCNINLPGLGE